MTIQKLIHCSGWSLADFSRRLKIPYRTVQDWANGSRQPPQYVVDLIQYRLEH